MRNGSTLIWNFNNGACLRRIDNEADLEISSVIFCDHKIVAAGWNRSPMIHVDSKVRAPSAPLLQKHEDDIMTLDYHK